MPGHAANRPRSTNSLHASITSCAAWRDITCGTKVPARTIQATALVHEAYLRLVDVTNVDWQHRAQFFAISARIMRNILLDNARARASAKRGGQQARVNLDEIPDVSARRGSDLMALDDALNGAGGSRPSQGAGHRAALLRRPERRGDGGGVEGVAGNRHARCQSGASLVEARIEPAGDEAPIAPVVAGGR